MRTSDARPFALRLVHDAVIACDRCPRLREYCERVGREKRRAYQHDTYWARPVPGLGDPAARILLLGLAPAAHGANRTGRMFTGDGAGGSGDFLMAALHRAGLSNRSTSDRVDDGLALRDVFITAAVRCAPPDNKPTPTEMAECLTHLDAELAALPNIQLVVALESIGWDACLRLLASRGMTMRPRPSFAHRQTARLPNGWQLVGCYHPSRQNTHTGRLTPPMMDDVFHIARQMLDRA